MARRATTGSDLTALLASREMVLVCGAGGVGKTTTAAAMGVLGAATRIGGRVLVLTIDPARRLADALGVGALGNEASRVPDAAFADAGITPRGELWAAMLDTKAGWDELIARHAPDPQRRQAVLANPLYHNITSRFVNSHDYLAMERLHELHASGRFDLIIVDTPPSRNALDVLDAPKRMMEFFGSRLLRWLTVPYRSRLFTAAARPFNQVADRVLGSRFLQDIAEFFMLFQSMERGFVDDARQVEQLLSDPRTTFVVVSTLEASPAHEAGYLARALQTRRLHLGAIVANRVLPASFTAKPAATSARKLAVIDGEAVTAIAEAVDAEPELVGEVLHAIGSRFHETAIVAAREAERRSELEQLCPLVVSVPILAGDVNDLSDLLAITAHW